MGRGGTGTKALRFPFRRVIAGAGRTEEAILVQSTTSRDTGAGRVSNCDASGATAPDGDGSTNRSQTGEPGVRRQRIFARTQVSQVLTRAGADDTGEFEAESTIINGGPFHVAGAGQGRGEEERPAMRVVKKFI